MIRLFSAVYLLGVLVISFLFQVDVSLTMNVAPQINAGSELLVSVTIKKEELSGFCRFQQELPAGFSASSVSTANADFTFKDQKVRFIWLKLPEESSITVSYKITCDERLKGTFNLGGKFSYIKDNQRQSADVTTQQITIIPSPNINPALIVDVNDFGKSTGTDFAQTDFGRIACVRQKPIWDPDKNEYVINILVNKEKLQKFAKIEENVPKGLTALNINSRDGIFTFKDGKAKFLWMNMPADPYFVVSYKLIPTNGIKGEDISLLGTFSYFLEDKTQSINIFQKDVDLASVKPEDIENILKPDVQKSVIAANTAIQTTTQVVSTNSKTPDKTAQPKVQDSIKKTIPVTTPNKQNVAATNTTKTDITETLNPKTGIYYRVQLAAGHKPVNIENYFRKFKLEKTVTREDHEGWIKYSVGSFMVYKDARDYRVHIWNTTPISDAFVSAYNDGKRITVQEALMVANQKWYK